MPALKDIYHYEALADWLGTAGQPTSEQFELIASSGYQAVINLALADSDNALADEGSHVAAQGMSYHHIPVDFSNPTEKDLALFTGVMNALEGTHVFVHCVVNARVSAFCFRYLTETKGWPADQATTRLLKKWEPQMDDTWRAFTFRASRQSDAL